MTTSQSEIPFESFGRGEWEAFTRDNLDYTVLTVDQQRELGLADTPHCYRLLGDNRIVRYTPAIEDPRLTGLSLTIHDRDDLAAADTAGLISLAYSNKEAIESSPHPETTLVRQLSFQLEELHERGFDLTNFRDGSLLEEAQERGVFN